MAWYPGAVRKKITVNKGRRKMAVYNRVNLHVAASEAASLFGYFNQAGKPDSHFYVLKNGTVEQYVDTKYRANADLEGNDATISIETQGGDQGQWTKAQVKAIAEIFAWAVKKHGIANKLASDSKLGGSSKGLSWHRLGIDGNFPSSGILRGRLQRGGGMKYSSHYGKTCPGDSKIKQIPDILELAKGAKPASKPKPKPSKPKHKKPKSKKIKADGYWGRATSTKLQEYYSLIVDGEIWSQNRQWRAKNPGLRGGWKWVAPNAAKGSPAIAALQRTLKVKADGILGPDTIRALQRRVGTVADGQLWNKSPAIKKLQKRLNKGKI